MYWKAKKNFGVIRKILEIFSFQNPLSKFSKIFFFKNFRIAPKFFFEHMLFLGQKFFVPEKKVVSLKKN